MQIAQGVFGFFSSIFLGPGFGLVALGRTRHGVSWLVVCAACMACTIFSLWMAPVAMAMMLLAAVDAAYVGARSAPGTFKLLRLNNLAMFVGVVTVLIGVRVCVVEAFKAPASSMAPTLMVGDHFFIDKLRAPNVGDVVVLRYPCNPNKDYVKRIVAKGGDRVEVRCNVLYVNERAVPNTLVAADCSYFDHDVAEDRWYVSRCSRYHETLGGHSYDVFHDAERPARDASPTHVADMFDFPIDSRTPSCALVERVAPNEVLGRVEGEAREDPCAPGGLHYVVPPGHVFVLGDNRSNSADSRIWGSVPESAIKGRATGIWYSVGNDGGSLSRFGAID